MVNLGFAEGSGSAWVVLLCSLELLRVSLRTVCMNCALLTLGASHCPGERYFQLPSFFRRFSSVLIN